MIPAALFAGLAARRLAMPALLAVCVGLLSAVVVQSVRLGMERSAVREAQHKQAQADQARREAESRLETLRAEHAQAIAQAVAQARDGDARLREIADAAEQAGKDTNAKVASANARAAAAEQRLRDYLRSAVEAGASGRAGVGAAAGDPAATGQCADATATSRMLADVLGRVLADGRRVAAFGDGAAAAADTCGRLYDEVRLFLQQQAAKPAAP